MITEKYFTTPRTYGSPTGYDREISHLPNTAARLAEGFAYAMTEQGGHNASDIPKKACDLAAAILAEWEKRGWMIEVTPAPDLDANYGKRHKGTP